MEIGNRKSDDDDLYAVLRHLPLADYVSLALIALCALATNSTAQPFKRNDPATQLIVLYNYDSPDLPLAAEDIVESVSTPNGNALTTAVTQRFGLPDSADFLVGQRLPSTLRNNRGIDDPEERMQRFVVLTYASERVAEIAYKKISADPNVISVEKNERIDLSLNPTDPLSSYPFSVSYSDWDYQWAVAKDSLGIKLAWNKVFGNAYVAVLDTGIDLQHPDLTQAFRRHLSYSPEFGDSHVDEADGFDGFPYLGHGTHVSGIIAANSRPSTVPSGYVATMPIGGAGVCWSCNLMSVKVADYSATWGYVIVSTAYWAAGLNFAATSGAQVVNMSLEANDGSCGARTTPLYAQDWR